MSPPLHSFTVPPDHPAVAGHFPGNPVVPGVVLLDLACEAIVGRERWSLQSIPSVRFLRPVIPGEQVSLEVELLTEGTNLRARFRGLREGQAAFEGSFLFSTAGGA